MSLTIGERNPLFALSCGVYAIAEEIEVASKVVTDYLYPTDPAAQGAEMDCDQIIDTCCDKLIFLPLEAIALLFSLSFLCIDIVWDTAWDTIYLLIDNILWLLCCNPSYNNVPIGAIEAARDYTLNRAQLNDIAPNTVIEISALPEGITPNDLLTLHIEFDRPTDPEAEGYAKKLEKFNADHTLLTSLVNYINRIKSQADHDRPQRDALLERKAIRKLTREDERRLTAFNKTVGDGDYVYKKALNIVHAMRETGDKDFSSLVEAGQSDRCNPLKNDAVSDKYDAVTRVKKDLKETFLSVTKAFKRALVLSTYDMGQYHVLNHALKVVGNWGLDATRTELDDPYERITSIFLTAVNFRYTLNRGFTPARILSNFKGITDTMKPAVINKFLEKLFENDPEASDPLLDADSPYYILDANSPYYIYEPNPDGGVRLSYKGVAWVLERMGYLTSLSSAPAKRPAAPEAKEEKKHA
ncbi:MAG: hypothetical protein HYX48_04545 [Chlamydiales bacterium]|nr:hypothetical protein [Chlamydiales bacterium]